MADIGGMTPFKNTKGTVGEGGFRVPAIIRWPGQVKPGSVENGMISGLDWLPTLMAAAGNPNITEQLLKGVELGDRTYQPSRWLQSDGSDYRKGSIQASRNLLFRRRVVGCPSSR